MDQIGLATAMGVEKDTIQKWENGTIGLGIFDVCRIAHVVNKSPYWIIHGRRDVDTDVLHLPSRATATVIHTPAW